jgi:acyl-CoA synthetase (AMP-forming)/AMP-acid ligase II
MDNFAAILDFHADRTPERVAVVDGDLELTYRGLLDRVDALALVLRELGVGEGDIVAILLANRAEFLETLFAANRIGAAFLPLNFRLAPDEWAYILGHSGAKVLVTESEFGAGIDGIAGSLPDLEHRLLVDGPTDAGGWQGYQALVDGHRGAAVPVADVAGDHLQRLMYTSGTTSRPKGVCISHRNTMYKNLGMIVHFGWTADQVTAVAGPLYHVGALDMGGLTTLHVGGRLVLQRRFDAPRLVALLEQHRATTVWLAPAMVNAVLQCEDEIAAADLSSVKLIMSGGEKMPEARLKQVLDVFPGLWFADAYGLTETVSSDTFQPYDRMRAKLGSVGKPLPHNRVRVVDDEGDDVPVDGLGEIVIRGPKVFSGYWRDAEATASAFRDGWFRTGDVGRLDADGFLYIEDRKKDMIVSGGENIATPEIERVLYEHPAVLEAAVIGHPDPRWGEVPHAFVVFRPDTGATTEDLSGFCRERLAGFKVPKYFDVVGALPRTPSGKVLKRELRRGRDSTGAGA